MNWALVFLACSRFCDPSYVELYNTKQECESHMNAHTASQHKGFFDTTYVKAQCVPVANIGVKK